MYILLIVIHVFVAFFMIGIVLLQAGKGAELGAAFGGSSQTLFGPRGSATFLSKMTVVMAGLFMVTSLSLAVMSKSRTVMPTTAPAPLTSDPAAPAATETTAPSPEAAPSETGGAPAAPTMEQSPAAPPSAGGQTP
jgi:preprotein translocase subunit SecG